MEQKIQCEKMRSTKEDEDGFWGKKLLLAIRKYNQLREEGWSAGDCALEDLWDLDEEGVVLEEETKIEEKEEGDVGREKLRQNTVAEIKVSPKRGGKRRDVQKATVRSKKTFLCTSRSKKTDGLLSHKKRKKKKTKQRRRRRKRRSDRKKRHQFWTMFFQNLRMEEGSLIWKIICASWIPQMMFEKERCFKRRRLKD